MSNSANIYGGFSGNSVIFGNSPSGIFPPQNDFITAFQYNNQIFSEGDNDTIYSTGLGSAMVHLAEATPFTAPVTDVVNLGGTNNIVDTGTGAGLTNSAVTVESGAGGNMVNITNVASGGGVAQNTVTLSEMNNSIVVNANATNSIDSGDGNGKVIATANGGAGFTSIITDAGQYNSVTVGNQNTTINGGAGFDTDRLGNGNNSITEAGSHDKIVVGTGSNVITDFGGNATITFTGLVGPWVVGDPVPWVPQTVNISGTNNVVTEQKTGGVQSDRDITVNGSGAEGNDTITLGNGIDTVTDSGNNTVITLGTTDHPIPPGHDTVLANGDNDNIMVGDANNVVTANGQLDTITLGNGNNTLTSNGNGDNLTLGNGNNTVTAGTAMGGGASDIITLGNGNNTLTADGTNATITVGNGNNHITANGDGTSITLGTGNNVVTATGESDTITSAGGKGTFTIGSNSMLSLTGSSLGTTVDSMGASNSIVLNNNANAAITDAVTGGNMDVTINASGGNSGVVSLIGFGSDGDPNGILNLSSFGLSQAQLIADSGSDGAGGTLIHLGTGSVDLVNSTLTFAVATPSGNLSGGVIP
jgi:hypothetical protein